MGEEVESLPRVVADGLLEGLQVISPDYRYLYVNEAVAAHGQVRREHLLGRRMWDVYPGIESTPMMAVLRACMIDRKPRRMENEFTFPDGSTGWFDLSFQPVKFGVAILSVDITERKRTERERSVVNEFLRIVNECRSTDELVKRAVFFFSEALDFEAVGLRLQEGIDYPYYEANGFSEQFVRQESSLCILDENGELVLDEDANPKLDCMCGLVISGKTDPSKPFFTDTGSFVTNDTVKLLASTSERDLAPSTRNRCVTEGYRSLGLFRLCSGEGCLGLLQLNDKRPGRFGPSVVALCERLAGYVAVGLAKSRFEEELVRSERRYRDLVANLDEVVVSTDARGILEYVSPAIARLPGFSPEDLTGRPFVEVACSEDREAVSAELAHVLDGEPRVLSFRALDGAGEAHYLRVTTRPRLDGGKVRGLDGVIADMTSEVRASREREQLEKQLALSHRLEAIGRLAGGVAHDFNNLLSVILGCGDFAIAELPSTDPIHDDLKSVIEAGERAAALTRQLLAFGRRQVLEARVIDVNEIVEGIEKMLRRLLGEDIEIASELAEALGRVRADPAHVEQVVMNLAINARDAMPGGGKLTIETENVVLDESYAQHHPGVEPGAYVMLSLSDTGSGMSNEVRERIFEPFFTTKERGEGSGLGLATVYGIVKQSGGNIWVYSEPGHGSTFKVYLPMVDAPVEETLLAAGFFHVSGGETILLVEDEAAVRRLAKRMLRSAGYEVLLAASCDEAIRICEEQGPEVDLLITDVVMPGMGGRELSERLATIVPGLPTLFVSGYTDNAIVHHGVLDEGTHFLSKPFSAAALSKKVREVLETSKAES